jgi:hypothetical protein
VGERPRSSRASSVSRSSTSPTTGTRAPAAAHVVTLTAGGNDLLVGEHLRMILRRLQQIAQRIQPLGAPVVVNNVYDPRTATTTWDGASWDCRGWRPCPDCSVEAVRLASTAVAGPPSASAVADGGELLGEAAAEGRHECEQA